MSEIIKIHDVNLGLRLQSISNWRVPEETRADVRLFIRELGLGKINRGRRLKENAQVKYLSTLKIPLELFNKKLSEITISDIEHFENALIADSIASSWTKRPYKHTTKIGIRKALKTFLRWKLGEAKSLELVGWLDTRPKEKTPSYLNEQEVFTLFANCRNFEQKYAIAVLFDSGARAEEFLNIRLEDLQLPQYDGTFAKIVLKQEYSKTKGRTVSLFWSESLEAVKDYVNLRLKDGMKPEDPIFNNTYGSLRMFLKRLGARVLKKQVHPHLFRHSSATFYAPKMNRQELCYRYGWRFSSNMPDVYISRAGMADKELDAKFTQTELQTLQAQLKKMEIEGKIKAERILALERQVALVNKHFVKIVELEYMGATAKDVERALEKSRSIIS